MQGCDIRYFRDEQIKIQSVDLALERFYYLPKRDNFYRVIIGGHRIFYLSYCQCPHITEY